MRFHYIKIKDLGPFSKKQVDFSGNLIGVVGPNGSGKSTLIELLYSAVSDHFRKYANLADFVRDRPNGEKCSSGFVEVMFDHGASTFTVRRTISVSKDKDGKVKGTQKAALKIEAGNAKDVEVTGVKNVDATLRDVLGEDISLLGNYAFIQQNEVAALVDSDASTRTRAMHKLFGLDRFEKVWNVLGEEIRTIPELRSTEDPESLKAERESLVVQLESEQDHLKRVKQQLTEMDVINAQGDIDKWESLSEVRDQLAAAAERVSNAQGYAMTRESQAASAQAEAKRVNDELSALRPKYEDAQAFLTRANEIQYAVRTKAALEARAAQLVKEGQELQASAPKQPDKDQWTSADETEFNHLLASLSVSSQFVSEHADLLDGSNVKANCPTCGQPIADLAANLEKHRNVIAELEPRVSAMTKRKQEIDAAVREYELAAAACVARAKRLTTDMEAVQREQAEFSAKYADVNPEDYSEAACAAQRQIISDYDSLAGALKAAERTWNTERHNADRAQVELKQATEDRNALQKHLSQLKLDVDKMTPEHINYCRGVVKAASDKKLELVRLEEQVKQLDIQLKSLSLRLNRALELQKQIERIKLVRDNLSDARDVFRRDKLPMLLAQRFLSALDSNIQRFLHIMQSDFTAELEQVDGSYNFLCTFGDATQRDASLLSGGEKVRFAISFLLAVNEVLSARFGVLALDEPTAQLDEDNIQYFMDVLSHVQQYAANAGVQVFLITHSAQLIGSFDQAITLSRAA